LEVDDNLLLLNKQDISKRLKVPAGSSRPFTMQLKALGVGNFPIRITATTTSSDAQDSVEKILFVKVVKGIVNVKAKCYDNLAWLCKTSEHHQYGHNWWVHCNSDKIII